MKLPSENQRILLQCEGPHCHLALPLAPSTVEFVKRETIGERTWVHGRQFESEVPNYYTDYFATVDDEIAILVTFSAYRQSFQTAFERFCPSIATIRPENRSKR